MVDSVVSPCLLVRRKIPGIFHHHDGAVIPLLAAADGTQLPVGQCAALPAILDVALGLGDGAGQPFYLFRRHIDNVKRQPLGRFAADTGELGQLLD